MRLPEQIGRYEILGILATGGMAEVLLARMKGPADFERVVVLKRVLPHLARETSFRTMFLDEARVLAGLRHPNVAQVQELGQVDDELFMVMEYIEGETLATVARKLSTEGGRLPAHLAAHVAAEAAAGLHAAHSLVDDSGASLGVVHRDVSPHNIMVTYDGRVKLIDFGIAKSRSGDVQTESGVLKGKFAYMSPEQCRAEPLDRRTDVWALCTVLHELSTGERLFQRGNEMATLRAICDQPVRRPSSSAPDYPEALEAVVMRGLAKDVAERTADAATLRRELIGAMRDLGSDDLPEEELSRFMGERFEKRMGEKRRMLAKARSGSGVVEIPAGEIQTLSEVVVDADAEGRRRRSRLLGASALLGSVALGLGLAWLVTRPSPATPEPAETTTERAPAPAPRAPTDAGALARDATPPATTVTLEVLTTPAGASVTSDEGVLGITPLQTELPRGTDPIVLRVELDGYRALEEQVVPDTAQRLRLTLRREAAPASRRRSRSRRRARRSSGGDDFFRFD